MANDIELRASELVMELEGLGKYGLGYFSGLLVEYKPALAEELVICIKLNQEELSHDESQS
jgi:hypothetical protein